MRFHANAASTETRIKTLHCLTDRHIAPKGFLRVCLAKLPPWLNNSRRECVSWHTPILSKNPGFGSSHKSRFLLKSPHSPKLEQAFPKFLPKH